MTQIAAPDAPVSNNEMKRSSDLGISQHGTSASPRKVAVTAMLIAVLALLLFGFRINRPPNEFWDEILYIRIARSLVHGSLGPMPQQVTAETFGRQHPPLGSYLIAAGIKVAGDRPVGWRLASLICGTLTAVALFLWTYVLLRDYALSVTATTLTLLNGFLYVMTRIAMLDVFLFAFVIWAVLAFTVSIVLEMPLRMRRTLMAASGILFGLAVACKWNAVDSLFATLVIAIGLLLAGRFLQKQTVRLRPSLENLRAIGVPTVVMSLAVLPIVVYSLTFWPLFRAMHEPFSAPALLKMHGLMMHLTKAATGVPTQYVPWYLWPFRSSPTRALSYLLGNPVVMWGGFFAMLFCASRLWKRIELPEVMLSSLYFANLLQWAVTPIRVPNYYYYYPAAMFLGTAIAVTLSKVPRRVFGVRLNILFIVAAAIVFIYCYQRMAYLEPPWDCMLGCWS